MLLDFAILAAGISGYGNGLGGARIQVPTAVYSAIVVLAILLVIDHDRPQRGLARMSQCSMLQMNRSVGRWRAGPRFPQNTLNSTAERVPPMKLPKNLGMLLLGIWLILTGLIPLLSLNFSGLGTIMAILAIAAGVFIVLIR
ncbi:MAG TPA: hypothetical protein DDW31_04790 [candidate division Zixibacteria bacterium]|nr:hypothetical protein [candidate division Zixibacteria bacterium]